MPIAPSRGEVTPVGGRDEYKKLDGKERRKTKVQSRKEIGERWRPAPVPKVEEDLNTCCNQFKSVFVHIIPIIILWIVVVAAVSAWNLLWFPMLFVPFAVILIFWKRNQQKLILLRWQLETFSWAFWVGSIIIFVLEVMLTFILVFTTLLPHIDEIKTKWEERPPDAYCQQFTEDMCESKKCAYADGSCGQQNAIEFLRANHKFFISCVGIWFFGLLLSIFAALIEESVKYYFMRRMFDLKSSSSDAGKVVLPQIERITKDYIHTILMLALMAGNGIGTGEAVQYTVIQSSAPILAFTSVLYRIVFRIPFHMVTAYMTGCNLSKNLIMNKTYQYPWYRCIMESVIFHSFYDCVTFFLLFTLIVFKSSTFIVGVLIFLLNLFGVFLGLRERAQLEEELQEYEEDDKFKPLGRGAEAGKPEAIAMDDQDDDDKINIGRGGRK